jgi:hypothetical protein
VRGVSETSVRGPSSAGGPPIPVTADLVPLMTSVADHRIDDLKQWIVNQQARWRATPKQPVPPILLDFVAFMSALTPGLPFVYAGVDEDTWDVLVQTSDGKIPLDLLSQGMSSILGWAGTLLQRMHEIYGDDTDVASRRALLLVDEIDAHLHPEWQQRLVSLMRDRFKGLQVIATTHSPLIVSGLKQDELYVLRRTPTQAVIVERAPWDLKGWRVDQILTSPTFGLDGARDLETVERVSEYTALASKFEPSPDEQKRLEVLAKEIEVTLPPAESKPRVRQASEMIEQVLEDRLKAMPTEEREKMVQELRMQVSEAITGTRRPS